MALNVMLDFESLSLESNAVLLSLGACTFNPETGEILDTFYAAIDPRTQPGRDINADTVLWWLKQDQAARDKLTGAVEATDKLAEAGDETTEDEMTELLETAAHPIQHVARAFIVWLEQMGEYDGVWSNGAVDHNWLDSMIKYAGYKNPVPFWKQRDYRTIRALNPDVKASAFGVAHNALDDAIKQANHLCLILGGAK